MFRIPMVWSIEKKERTVLYGEEGAKGRSRKPDRRTDELCLSVLIALARYAADTPRHRGDQERLIDERTRDVLVS